MLGLGSSLSTSGGSAFVDKYSIVFDGDDYLNTGATFQSTYRGSFSWSFWMKPDDGQPSGNKHLLGSDNTADEDAFYLELNSAGKIQICHEANDDSAFYQADAAVYANGAGAWKHICVTITYNNGGADTSYVIYVNGSAIAATLTNAVTEGNHENWTSTENTFIGNVNGAGSAPSPGNPFTGKMDDVALFNVALDADAVTAIYNSGVPFNLINNKGNYDNASALVGYWRMEEGTTIYDQTGNGNNATLVGDPTFSTDTPDD